MVKVSYFYVLIRRSKLVALYKSFFLTFSRH